MYMDAIENDPIVGWRKRPEGAFLGHGTAFRWEMRSTGSVDVRAYGSNGSVVLQVRDSGPGIAAEAKEKLFLPYYSTKGRGSGLGRGRDDGRRLGHAGAPRPGRGGRELGRWVPGPGALGVRRRGGPLGSRGGHVARSRHHPVGRRRRPARGAAPAGRVDRGAVRR